MSPRRRPRAWLVLSACLLAWADPLASQELASRSGPASEQVKIRIHEVRESTRIDEAVRTRAIELYQQLITNLETTRVHRKRRDGYREATGPAPGSLTGTDG